MTFGGVGGIPVSGMVRAASLGPDVGIGSRSQARFPSFH